MLDDKELRYTQLYGSEQNNFDDILYIDFDLFNELVISEDVEVTKVSFAKTEKKRLKEQKDSARLAVIRLYENEGNTPHFHIRFGKADKRKGDACITIYEPAYFSHNDKTKEKLTKKEAQLLDAVLRLEHHKEKVYNKENNQQEEISISNWQFIKRECERYPKNNKEVTKQQKEMTEQPDYTKLS